MIYIIHAKDIHWYHERDEDDTDSQDESYHARASHLLSDGVILHLFTLLFSLYMVNDPKTEPLLP